MIKYLRYPMAGAVPHCERGFPDGTSDRTACEARVVNLPPAGPGLVQTVCTVCGRPVALSS